MPVMLSACTVRTVKVQSFIDRVSGNKRGIGDLPPI